MNKQLKPGDMALIVGANHLTQNIGKACELVRLVAMDEIYSAPNGKTYQHSGTQGWIVAGEGIFRWHEDGSVEQGDWALCDPRHLRPLRGDFQPESEKSAEVTP